MFLNKYKYLSLPLYTICFKLLLLLRSLKIDFWSVRHMRHRVRFGVGRTQREVCASKILTQLVVKNLTPQRHELPTNKSAAAACHLRADKQMDEYIGQTSLWLLCIRTVYVQAGTPTNCCERFADA